MKKFFKLEEHNTTVSREIIAGITTFFTMAYIIFVNPEMLAQSGMPQGGVFLATIIASVTGTLIMGLFANVPYAQAPGMGLNSFFVYTICIGLNFKWQQALAMVFICGILNILITVTRFRRVIIKAIPISLQHAMGAGIGIFIAYNGIKNAGFLQFLSNPGDNVILKSGGVIANSGIVPSLVSFNNPAVMLSVIGMVIFIILIALDVKGAIFLGIAATTVVGAFMGVVDMQKVRTIDFGAIETSFHQLGKTFGAAFSYDGLGTLFINPQKIPIVLMTIFTFSLFDIFDTLGTFIGTSRKTGIFTTADESDIELGSGFKSRIDRALFADSIATSIGAVFGTSNTTTYIESAAGIASGGRTGLTSVVTAGMFLLSVLFAPFLDIVPTQATAPALIIVGITMTSSFKEIDWDDLYEAIPCFFVAIFMALCYSISNGIAIGFLFYCLTKIFRKKAKEVHPVLWVSSVLFLINFVILAIMGQ